jgi:hypothetical protein
MATAALLATADETATAQDHGIDRSRRKVLSK